MAAFEVAELTELVNTPRTFKPLSKLVSGAAVSVVDEARR